MMIVVLLLYAMMRMGPRIRRKMGFEKRIQVWKTKKEIKHRWGDGNLLAIWFPHKLHEDGEALSVDDRHDHQRDLVCTAIVSAVDHESVSQYILRGDSVYIP